MAEFSEKRDYTIIVKEILKVFNLYFIELQLVWLWELILIYTYLYLVSMNHDFKYNSMNMRLVGRSNVFKYVETLGYNPDAVKCLGDFRNQYVHAGSASAFNKFKDLFQIYKADINQIALHFGVTLNWVKIGYLEYGEKQRAKVEK